MTREESLEDESSCHRGCGLHRIHAGAPPSGPRRSGRGVDNLNAYYDVRLKQARLDRLSARSGFLFSKLDIVERKGMAGLFSATQFDVVVHLAAQAGVRYSIENPGAYIDANLVGFLHVLEGCRHS